MNAEYQIIANSIMNLNRLFRPTFIGGRLRFTKKIPKDISTATDSHQKKKTKEEILKKINHLHVTDGKSFKQIKDDLVQMQADGVLPNMVFEDKEPIYFNNLWNRWKKRQKE